MGKNIRKCPYCGEKVSYFGALSEINSGEHTCPRCNTNSNISYSKKIYIPTAAVLVIAIGAALLLFKLNIMKNLILACVLVLIPFIVFFFLTPVFFFLEPIKGERARIPVQKIKQSAPSSKEKQKNQKEKKQREEKKRQEEPDQMGKNNGSFKSKFSNFIKTYVIVDDDEQPETSSGNIEEEEKDDDLSERSWSVMGDYSGSNLGEENEVTDDYNEGFDEDEEEEPVSYQFGFTESYRSSGNVEDIFSSTPEDKIKQEKNNNLPEKREPVYHKLTKTTQVDHVYYPESEDQIHVDIFTQDEPEKPEEKPVSEEDMENEEIMSFFNAEPSDEEEKEFGVKEEIKKEEKEVEEEPQKQEAQNEPEQTAYDEDLFEYYQPRSLIHVDLFGDKREAATEEEKSEPEEAEENDTPADDVSEPEKSEEESEINDLTQAEAQIEKDISEIMHFGEPAAAEDNSEGEKTENADEDNEVINEIKEDISEDKEDSVEIASSFTLVDEEEESSEEAFDADEPEDENQEEDQSEAEEDVQKADQEENPKEDISEEPENDITDDSEEEEDVLFEADEEENIDSTEPEEKSEDNRSEKKEISLEKKEEESFVVEFSGENDEVKSFQEELDLSEYQTSNYSAEASEEDEDDEEEWEEDEESEEDQETSDEESDEDEPEDDEDEEEEEEEEEDLEDVIDEAEEDAGQQKLSRYEKKFPNAAKAAAFEVKENERRRAEAAERLRIAREKAERSAEMNMKKAGGSESLGFFSKIKNRIIEATEQERQEVFEMEERERRIAEKEAKRKAREKEKKESPKSSRKNSEKAPETERKPRSVSLKEEKEESKSHTRIFEPIKNAEDYAAAEKEIFEKVKEEMESEPQKKLTSQDKAKIIAQRANAEKLSAENEKKKRESDKKNAQTKKKDAERKRRESSTEKAEEIRREQMKEARRSQERINNSSVVRKPGSVSLKQTDNVRSKVSQKKKKRKQQADDYFGDNR